MDSRSVPGLTDCVLDSAFAGMTAQASGNDGRGRVGMTAEQEWEDGRENEEQQGKWE